MRNTLRASGLVLAAFAVFGGVLKVWDPAAFSALCSGLVV